MGNRNMDMARRIARAAAEAGGRTFFVGGWVRDRLMGIVSKDIDLEVHGVPYRTLEGILDGLGERLEMGASFGVLGLRHYGIDIALPRSETATGRGHRDFDVSVDPFLGPERAARRRDFTFNALMQDVLTGELLDFFGGAEDLRRGIVRHVDDRSFPEDPLRVFRAAQFAARFGFSVAEETAALAARMDVTALPGERVMGELEKALTKAQTPSVFFRELRRMGQLSVWFPEAETLLGGPTGPEAWARALKTLDGAAALRERTRRPLWFMLAALCRPLGSGPAERLLRRLTRETRLTEYVTNMLEGLDALAGDAPPEDRMALFDRSQRPEELLLLAQALAEGEGARWTRTEAALQAALALYRERMARPAIQGRDLLAAGAAPGPALGQALALAHGLRLAGRPREEQLAAALAFLGNDEDRKGGV